MFKNLRKLFWFIKKRRKNFIIGLLVLQLANLIIIVPPIIIGKSIDLISKGTLTWSELTTYVCLMIALFTSEYICNFVWSYNVFSNAIVIDFYLQQKIIKKILSMPRPFFEKFSSGQRQLISFARALAQNPKILILDEATSSIDSQTKEIIQNAMSIVMKGRTTFIIAHRLSTIKNADKIYLLEKGKIIESGNHESLIQNKGKYYEMYQAQNIN